jgi:phage recombination protein Bet
MSEIKKEEVEKVSEKIVMEYINTFITTKLSERETKQFVQTAVACNLNPLKKEIYCVVYGEGSNRKFQILTGYEVYLKRAERLMRLNGWNVKTDGTVKGGDLKAVCTIFRKDWTNPFIHEVYFNEYNSPTPIWKMKPITMIRKVVIAQAFRLAFPLDFEDLPYIEEEIANNFKQLIKDYYKSYETM